MKKRLVTELRQGQYNILFQKARRCSKDEGTHGKGLGAILKGFPLA